MSECVCPRCGLNKDNSPGWDCGASYCPAETIEASTEKALVERESGESGLRLVGGNSA
jgi:hypothetical protein